MTMMAGIGGLVGGISGLLGGNASSITPPNYFNMPGMTSAANSALSGINQYNTNYGTLGASTLPYAQNIFSSLYNNPYSGSYQTGATTAGNLGTSAALSGYGLGQSVAGAGSSLLPYSQSIMNTAFDPQQALYNLTAGQTQQGTLANLANSGLANTPYGQSVLGNTMGNFNINWQNNQLAREAEGASAASGLVGAGGSAMNLGAGMMNAAPGQYLTAAGMPYSTASTIGTGQNTALSSLLGNYGTAGGIDTSAISNYLNYLGAGNAANQTNNQLFQELLNQSQLSSQQNLTSGMSLAAGLAMLGKGTTSNSPLLGGLLGSGSGSTILPSTSFLTSGFGFG